MRKMHLWVCFLAALWSGAGIFAAAQTPGVSPSQAATPPKILVDKQALPRDVRSATSFAPVVKKAAPSVVTVFSTKTVRDEGHNAAIDDPILRRFFGLNPDNSHPPRERREHGLGSGVIVSPDGYILSNNHVVEGAEEIKVRLAEGGPELDAKVVGTDPPTDIAVLKIQTATNLHPITIADSSTLQVGDTVLAMGNPFGVGQTVTLGIVSAIGRGGFGIEDYEDFIQTDAAINPGNSGGALIDAQGRLVGVPVAILSRTGGNVGIGFAVPSNMARLVMDRIIKDGRVVRGYLGVYVQPLTPQLAQVFNVPSNVNGALISGVSPKGPAAAAGLQDGDVIAEMNGKAITDSRHLRLLTAQIAPNTQVNLKIFRDGKPQTVSATLGELPVQQKAQTEEQEPTPTRKTQGLEGVEVTDLDGRLRQHLEIPSAVQGALVVNVDRDAAAYTAGLRPGDVVVEINRQTVHNAREAADMGRKTRSARTLLKVWSDGGTRYLVVEPPKRQK